MVRVQLWDEEYGQIFTGPVLLVWGACWSIVWVFMHPLINTWVKIMDKEVAKEAKGKRLSVKYFLKLRNTRMREAKHWESAPTRHSNTPARKSSMLSRKSSMLSRQSEGCFSERGSFAQRERGSFAQQGTASSATTAGPVKATGSFSYLQQLTKSLSWSSPTLQQHSSMSTQFDRDRLAPHLMGVGRTKSGLMQYRRQLQREFIYYSCAALTGLTLTVLAAFSNAPNPMEDLLTNFNSVRQVIFAGAMGHWVVSIFSDICCCQYMAVGLDNSIDSQRFCFGPLELCVRNWTVLLARIFHHVIKLVTYGSILWTNRMGGMGVQTLLGEFPMIYWSRRKIAYTKDVPPAWMCNPKTVKAHWAITMAMFLIARLPMFGLWLYTLLSAEGSDILHGHLDSLQEMVYNVLLAMFAVMNISCIWIMVWWIHVDLSRADVWLLEHRLTVADMKNMTFAFGGRRSIEYGNANSIEKRRDKSTKEVHFSSGAEEPEAGRNTLRPGAADSVDGSESPVETQSPLIDAENGPPQSSV